MHASNDESEITGWLGVVFEDNPETFESQAHSNPNRQKPKVTPTSFGQSLRRIVFESRNSRSNDVSWREMDRQIPTSIFSILANHENV